MNKNIVFSFVLAFCFLSFYLTEQSWAQSEQNIIIPAGSSVRGCELDNLCFIPSIFEAELGDTIVWINEDEAIHVITSGTTSFGPDGKFQSDPINPGESFSLTFEKGVFEPGPYFYFDAEHLWMKGLVLVNEPKDVVEEEVEETIDEEIEETIDEEIVETTDEETDIPPPDENNQSGEEGGGCLIATAAYGSELSPQVQQLREIRDNFIMKTDTGSKFMNGFNQFYYSFSPTVADWERQFPIFKDSVKIIITPLLTTLSMLTLVDVDSEAYVIGLGIGIISLNAAIYFIAPTVALFKIKQKMSSKK